jgi:hypothetical protein
MTKNILFISNGHGEDLVAAEIIKELKKQSAPCKIWVLPVVGEGKAFEQLGIEAIGKRKKLPSGGFSLRNPEWLLKDLASGLLGQILGNIGTLKKLRNKIDVVVGIGDIVPIIGSIITGAPFIFIGVNKSDYYKTFGYSYTPWEKWLLKRRARIVFTRDEITAENLKRQRIKAEYIGNPLMDCCGQIQNPNDKIQTMNNSIIGFLPGTREDVGLNLEDFDTLTKEIVFARPKDKKVKFMVAIKDDRVLSHAPFAEVISQADIIIGLSGTGNEQAAGMGKPVVSFPGRGSQYNKRFAEAQKELLGDSLCLVKRDPKTVANEVWAILKDEGRYEKMSAAGRERMGSPGAVPKIAEIILKTW